MSEVEGRGYHLWCLLSGVKPKSHFLLKVSIENDLTHKERCALVIEGQSTLGSCCFERGWNTYPLNLVCSHSNDTGTSAIVKRLPTGIHHLRIPQRELAELHFTDQPKTK